MKRKKYRWNRQVCARNFARLGKKIVVFIGRFAMVTAIMLLLSAEWKF